MKKIKSFINNRFRFHFTQKHILDRLHQMEILTSIYASHAANSNITSLKETYQDMSNMYLKRYHWYLGKLMNREFEKG